MQLLWGLLFAAMVAGLALKAGTLSRSGALAAGMTGGLIFGLGGLAWAALLLAFFISSSLLSRLFAAQKADLKEKFSKGSRRDWAQVLANGGLGALLAVVWAVTGQPTWAWLAYAGAMAAVNADTWATELGVLNPAPPRSIATFKPVEKGASGGVSLLGTLAAAGGALLIAILAAALASSKPDSGRETFMVLASVVLGGVSGAFFDSILGATVQAIYFCPSCKKETERHPLHTCGTPTIHLRGWRWLNNDLVNFCASVVGMLVVIIIWW